VQSDKREKMPLNGLKNL